MSYHLIQAELCFKQSKYLDSLQHIQKALQEDPTNAGLLTFRGLCLIKTHAFAEADQCLKKAMKIDPNSDFTHYIASNLALEIGNYKVAEQHIRHAIDINPIHAEYYGVLALCLYNRHADKKEIKELLKKGLSFDPQNHMCKNVLAMTELRQGKRKLASDIMEFHLEKHPNNSLSLANQGWNHLHTGDYDNAYHFFDEALKKDRKNTWAKTGRLQALKAKRHFYRPLLRILLYMTRVSPKKRFGVLFGTYFLLILLSQMSGYVGTIAAWSAVLYIFIIYLSWLADTLATAFTAYTEKGRTVISDRERMNISIMAFTLILTGVLASLFFLFRSSVFLIWAAGLFFLSIPLYTFMQNERPKRKRMAGITLVILGGFLSVSLVFMYILPSASIADFSAIATLCYLSLALITNTLIFTTKH